MQADSFAGPVGHRDARELGAVVAAQHGRVATHGRDAAEFVDEVVAGDVAFDESAEAFAGVFVDDRCDLDRAAVSRGVEPEVDGPDRVRGVGDRCPSQPSCRLVPGNRYVPETLAPSLVSLILSIPKTRRLKEPSWSGRGAAPAAAAKAGP